MDETAPVEEANPLDALDETPAAQPTEESNPLDALDSADPSHYTSSAMTSALEQAGEPLPAVTVSARGGPQASWGDVASALPTALGAKIESKLAGAEEYRGNETYGSARKKLWQSMILPEAVRNARDKGIPLTEDNQVVDIARHLGIRPDQFTRDWPDYANQTEQERREFQAAQRERIQQAQPSMEEGAQRRQTAARVSELYRPNMGSGLGLKSIAFDTATMIPDLLAGTAATLATGPVGGAAFMAADIAPDEYSAARNEGLDHRHASTYAALSTLASSVPEIPVFKILDSAPAARKIIGSVVGEKFAATVPGKVVGTSVAQGVTQATVQALQEGIDSGLLDRQDTLPDALKKIAAAGLTGAVAGSPMGGLHAAMHREPRASALGETQAAGEAAPGPASPEAAAAAAGPSSDEAAGLPLASNSSGGVNPEAPRGTPYAPDAPISPHHVPQREAPAQAEGALPAQRPIPALIEPGQAPQREERGGAPEGGRPLPVKMPDEGEISIGPVKLSGADLHAALQAVEAKTISPPMLEALERMKLATRNDVNVPRLLPAGRRALAKAVPEAEQPPVGKANIPPESAESGPKPVEIIPEVAKTEPEAPMAAPKSAEISQIKPKRAGPAPVEPDLPIGSTGNRYLEDPELRDSLAAMKSETGWAQVGGRVLRNEESGAVTGRTSWIPNAEWWPGVPKELNEPQIHAAVDKALAGKALSKPEARVVDFMTQVHDERTAMQKTHQELREAVPELHEQPPAAVDLTLLVSRAGEHDANATAKIIDTWADDEPATIARVQGELERIIGRGQQKQEFSLEHQGAGRVEPAAPQRTPAARDLFGEDRSKEQALADEQRRRDALRSPNKDVSLETSRPGDLFSQAQRQVDLTEQLKAARAETHAEPSEGRREAGNYKKGRVDFAGMEVAIENPKGSTRRGVGPDGKPWERTLEHDYGYFTGSKASDHEGVDVFLTGKADTGKMFVINQIHPDTGKYDEAKVVAGAESVEEAERTYKANYQKGWKGLGSMAEMSTDRFRQWLAEGDTHKPVRTNVERRADTGQRKKVAEMTGEEAKKALLTHELTGIPNRRAYIESEKLPAQVSIDVDSLKAINDTAGHHAGDELLKAVATVLHEETEHAYHLSGDEFAIQALHPREANAIMERAVDRLKNAEIIVSMPDGRTLSLKGLGVSFGVGEDLAKADTALQAHKKVREAQGARATRGEIPPGLTIRPSETGREDRGRQATTEKQTLEKTTGLKSRRTSAQDRSTVIAGDKGHVRNIPPGMPVEHLARVVHQTIRASGLGARFPHVEVHEDMSSLPEHLQIKTSDGGEPSAAFDPTTGRIHMLASGNATELEARSNLWHEAVGHYGLRAAMDPARYNEVMDGLYRDMPERVQDAAYRNGLDLNDPTERRVAAEEVIAYAAGQIMTGQAVDKPILPYWTRVVRAVKAFFAKVTGTPFYDERAIAGLVQEAQTALERGTSFNGLNEGAVRSQHAERFYSPVDRAVGESKQGKASAEQWLATIKKMAGVKPEELEWLGLEPWLKAHDGPITKAELQDYIRANSLELQETVHHGGTPTELQRAQIRLTEELRAEGHLVSFDDDGYLDLFFYKKPKIEADEDPYLMLYGPAPSSYSSMDSPPAPLLAKLEELEEISHNAAVEKISREEPENGAQYQEYTLPGGENYRELLLRLPESPNTDNYRSDHWEESNILAHVRFKERTDPDGKRVLFLEELQSDWHQQGRQRGYPQDAETIRAAQEKRDEAGRALAEATSMVAATRATMELDPQVSYDRFMEAIRERDAAQDRLSEAQKIFDQAKGAVPDAPFKTTWPMLIMKRMVRWAAEHGFDRVAWTTGEQQNERYGLHSVVKELEWKTDSDGKQLRLNLGDDYIAVDIDPQGKIIRSARGGEEFIGHELSDVIGQELAQKVASGDQGELSGEGLKVGGSGMTGFYDDILPRETNKLIKKFGGKVADTRVLGVDTHQFNEARDVGNQVMVDSAQLPAHGFDITPEMRTAALSQGFPLFAKRQAVLPLQQPGPRGFYERVRKAVDWLMENPVTRDVRKLTAPTNLSAESKEAARVAREYLGSQAAWGQRSQEALEHFSRQIDKLPVQEQLDMMDRIEHGLPQQHPELQPAADGMREMLDTWRDKVRDLGIGALDNFIENYFPHYWADPGDAKRLVASIQGRRPLKGPASFLKLRTIPTIKEGMDAGLKPLTVNPLVMTLLKTREMQRFITGVTLMKRFKEDGLAVFLKSGRPMPEGWAPINDNSAKVRSWSEEEGGWIERGQYVMPEDAARIINNHVSQSWLKSFAPAQVFRVGANLLNALQLGFSAFHLGFTTLDAIISKTALGMESLLHGEVGKAARNFGEVTLGPLAAVNNVRRGYKLLETYTNPAGATPELAKIVKALEVAGGRAHMDKYYMLSGGVSPFRGVGVRSLAKDIHSALTQPTDRMRNVGKAVGNFAPEYATKLLRGMQSLGKTHTPLEIPFEVAGRLVRASTSWIMEHLVPMQKLGVFSDLAKAHIDRHPTENPNDQADSLQRIWASVDNRLGEMVYDNLFWDRTFKDTLHFGIRAVGWNVGTVREIAGAPVDAMKLIDTAIRTGKITADDVGHKIPYVLAMTMTTALYGAILNYLFTGEGPQEAKDYFFPRTGGQTNYGTPQRVSLPSYVKDVYEYSQRPGHTVLNKLNPIFNVIGEMWNNEDFFGNPITDPNAGFWKSLEQRGQFVAGEAKPFSLQGAQQLAGSEKPGFVGGVKRVGPYVGIAPAPGYVTSPDQMERRERSEREKKYASHLKYLLNKAVAAKDKDEIERLRKEYIDAQINVKKTQVEVDKDKARSAVSRRKAATSMRQQGLPHTANLVASLPLEPDAAARQYFTEQAAA